MPGFTLKPFDRLRHSDLFAMSSLCEGFPNALLEAMLREERISISNGQDKLKGKIIRIAHMGYIKRADVDAGLAALAKRLPAVHA